MAAAAQDAPPTTLGDAIAEFLEVSIHQILYTREIYPSALFERRRQFGAPVRMSRHPALNSYIAAAVSDVRASWRAYTQQAIAQREATTNPLAAPPGGHPAPVVSCRVVVLILQPSAQPLLVPASSSSSSGSKPAAAAAAAPSTTQSLAPARVMERIVFDLDICSESQVDPSTSNALTQELRAFVLKMSTMATVCAAIPKGCTWSLLLYTADTAHRPDHRKWIPAEPNAELSHTLAAEELNVHPLKELRTDPVSVSLSLFIEENKHKLKPPKPAAAAAAAGSGKPAGR